MQVHQTPTVLLTRPRAASERFGKGLNSADVVVAPLMEIVGTAAKVDLAGVAGLILTSGAAVPFLPPTNLPAYCVGPHTAAAAAAAGMRAQALGGDAEGLVAALAERRPEGPLLHLHGTHTRGDIVGRLCELGLNVSGLTVYDQREISPGPDFDAALTRARLIVPLFSPRSATLFANAAKGLRDDARIIALSQAVADALPRPMAVQTIIAGSPTGTEMSAILSQLGVKRNCP